MSRYKHAAPTIASEKLFREAISDMVSKCNNINTLVDLGSGDGVESHKLQKIVSASKLICVDHDQATLKKAVHHGARGVAADLNDHIRIKSNSVDLIIANQVIEHIAKTDNLILEIKRLLSHNGVAIICTPNLASWHNIVALMLGYQPFSSQVSDKWFLGNPLHPLYKQEINEAQAHLRLFTHRSLADLCQQHGLEVIESSGVGYYPFSGKLAKFLSWIDWRHSAYILCKVAKK